MSPRIASQPGSGLFSTFFNALVVLVAIAVLAGGLFVASDAIATRAQSSSAPQSKIGPAYDSKRPTPASVARADAPAAPMAPVVKPEPVVDRVVTAAKPDDQQPPVTAVVAPVEPPPAAKPAAPDRTEAANDRPAPGSAGCTRYRTYNPTTQTYRAFDGTIKRCASGDRGT